MKASFYPKLALDGIRKNKRMYIPYILTCIGMVMMYYIMVFLEYCDALSSLRGGSTIREMIGLGAWVIGFFALIFLFYTNSFLMRRRKKEFGLYNILGMGKRNIGVILFWESLMIALFSIAVGILGGVVLSKLAELGMIRIMQGEAGYDLSVSLSGISMTFMLFSAIFALLFLNSLRQVRFASAISLLRSENTGEKPPKGNFVFAILGVLMLGVAYYFAVTIENPVTALLIFFIAVLLVIAGTYLIMISGSVFFCKVLQKRKKYYYKPNHFVSVSSMVYRMKRNGAGLASICVLATMVLVMISSTTCLYFGSEDALKSRYPRDINMTFRLIDTADLSNDRIPEIREGISSILQKHGITPSDGYSFRCAEIAGLIENGVVETDVTKVNAYNANTLTDVYEFYFIPIADYNEIMGTSLSLDDGEAYIYNHRSNFSGDNISFNQGKSFKVKGVLREFVNNGDSAMTLLSSIMIIVPDLEEAIQGLDTLANYNGDRMITLKWYCNFDTGIDEDRQIGLYHELLDEFRGSDAHEKYGHEYTTIESQENERDNFFGLFGGLFYLGIMLSIVFIFAAVLIIYYKQVSEGYEDKMRFDIMQKVGMTKREIRKSINSQLLTVFFLPLIFAALHLAFAFPIITRLLLLFNLNNVMLFALTTMISVAVFALFYTLVYRITSNAYYNIVSGAKGENT